jgi:hypothetical protein
LSLKERCIRRLECMHVKENKNDDTSHIQH